MSQKGRGGRISEGDNNESNSESRERAQARAALLAAAAAASASASRSRRKPAAPQWVRPEWKDQEEPTAEGKDTINGVCVLNSYASFSSKNGSSTSDKDESKHMESSASPQPTDITEGES